MLHVLVVCRTIVFWTGSSSTPLIKGASTSPRHLSYTASPRRTFLVATYHAWNMEEKDYGHLFFSTLLNSVRFSPSCAWVYLGFMASMMKLVMGVVLQIAFSHCHPCFDILVGDDGVMSSYTRCTLNLTKFTKFTKHNRKFIKLNFAISVTKSRRR
jgi:hypothetical protein